MITSCCVHTQEKTTLETDRRVEFPDKQKIRESKEIRLYTRKHCYVGVCGGEDSLEHVSQCFGYTTVPSGDGSERAQVEYLVELNKERLKRPECQ